MKHPGGVERNYTVESHDEAGLLTIRVGADLVDTLTDAREWVGDAAAIRPGGLFDHFRPAEKAILRSSIRASRPRRRRAARVLG